MSSERLMETFDDIYEGKNEIQETNFEAKSRQSRQASLGGLGKGLMKRLRKIKFMGRPFLRPDGAADRAVCQVTISSSTFLKHLFQKASSFYSKSIIANSRCDVHYLSHASSSWHFSY